MTKASITALITSALLLSGCAVEVENTQAAQELAQRAKPPGSVYAGWRVFQDKCASCHGVAASGTVGAPDLLPRVRDMNPRQFVNLVLTRYDWGQALAQASRDQAARETLVDSLLQRKGYMLTMPAWQGEPGVNAHILDVYAYLSARADGTQGPDRPAR
nr:c-type cytochrome [uncultured Rhodoferax sp.]